MTLRCKMCHAVLKPLFSSHYCPNDCDRKDDWDEDTEPTVPTCHGPMATFAVLGPVGRNGWHCWTCGKVEWNDP